MRISSLLLLVGLAGCTSSESQPNDPQVSVEWLTSYETAVSRAKAEEKAILINFTGSDWCKWCIHLEEEVFSTPEFTQWAAENVILLKCDFPNKTKLAPEQEAHNAKLQEKYKVESFPTILFIRPDGTKIGESGYEPGGPKPWTARASEILAHAAH